MTYAPFEILTFHLYFEASPAIRSIVLKRRNATTINKQYVCVYMYVCVYISLSLYIYIYTHTYKQHIMEAARGRPAGRAAPGCLPSGAAAAGHRARGFAATY